MRTSVAGKRNLIYWICQVAGWSAFCGFGLLFVLFGGGDEQPLWKFVITYGAGVPVAVAFSHLYRLHIRRRGWAALGLMRLLPRMAAASAVLGTILPFLLAPVWFVVFERVDPFGAWAPIAVLSWTWSVFVWSVLYFGVHYFERWRQAEVDKLQLAVVAAEARLHGLMSQLNPHFLFNCLNSVRALIVEDPARAQATVTALSNLMRYTLQAGRIATVPLETEMDMVETYLSLEGVRLDERLTSQIEIAPDTRSIPVPTMLVQLLVENGVKHGIERLPAGGTIRVASWLERDSLRICVSSSGRIIARDDSTRVGLANARERLRIMYGARASLALREDGPSVVAELSVPVGGQA